MEQEVGLYPQHTVEVIQHTSRRQIVITMGMALAIVFIANFLAYYVPMDRTETVVYQKWGLIQDLDAPVDWLIVGDSSANHGVIPAIITQELGGEALNVATFGDWLFVDDAWMIETHIRQVGAPKNIIIVHVPDMYHRTMEANVLLKSPLEGFFWLDYAVKLNALSLFDEVNLFLSRYIPLYYRAPIVEEHIESYLATQAFLPDYRGAFDEQGYMAEYEAEASVVEQNADDLQGFADRESFRVSDINQEALQQIITVAEDYDIEVFLFISPMFDELYEDDDFKDYVEALFTYLEDATAASSHVHVITDVATFQADEMQNSDHLIQEAAEDYTRYLVTHIQEISDSD